MLRPEGFERQADVWEILFQAKQKGSVLRAAVGAVDYINDDPAWVVIFPQFDGNIKGLVPSAETGMDKVLLNRFVGQDINVKIIAIDQENKLLACSRKQVVEESWEKLDLTEGQIISCAVRAIVPKRVLQTEAVSDDATAPTTRSRASLLVDIGGGILIEIPYNRATLADPSYPKPLLKQYSIGQTITAKVVKIGFGNDIVLSVREAQPDPWLSANYKSGQIISGTVARIHGSHVFVEPDLTAGILGLASYPTIGNLRSGQRISCVVSKFSSDEKKLHLRYKGHLQRRV